MPGAVTADMRPLVQEVTDYTKSQSTITCMVIVMTCCKEQLPKYEYRVQTKLHDYGYDNFTRSLNG